jgi:Ras GTPase-activating-like protein IQGAP2/3
MDSELSSPSPPDVVAEDEGHLERTDAGKTLDCVGDDVVQRFTAAQVEIQQLKDKISFQSKENFRKEKDLRYLDSKIALLIGHKISADEVELRVFDDHSTTTGSHDLPSTEVELYGYLFFSLQTSPHYIASLTRQVTLKEIDGLLQIVMFTLYGNQYENREELLLLSMFEHSLTYEVQEATEANSLMRANTAITRMMTTYCRRGPGQEYVKSALGEVVQNILSYDKSLEIDPLKIFHEMMERNQVRRPSEPKAILEAAQNHPTVHEYIQSRIPILQEFILQILQRLRDTIRDVPYGIRWLCKAIRALVQEKFPDVSPERINSLIGGFFLLRYINPIIVAPHNYRLVSTPPSRTSRRNLTLIAKLIQKLANTSSVREDYMMPLEPFVKLHNEALKSFLNDLCDVNEFHEALQLEEYIALCRKEICIDISVNEMALVHTLLLKYRENIVRTEGDEVLTYLRDLPEPTGEMSSNQTHVKLALLQHPRENLGMPVQSPRGVSLDVYDELATTKRQCRHLLKRLFRVTPHCLDRPSLHEALKQAEEVPLRDVPADARLASEHVATLQSLGGPSMLVELYAELRTTFQDRERLLQEAEFQLRSLRGVYETMIEHTDTLMEQLDAYRGKNRHNSTVHCPAITPLNCVHKKGSRSV